MRKTTLFTTAFILLILILGVRLFWTVAKTETGWTVLKQQWRDATVGFFIGDQIPIRCLEPTDQADFWLRETQRITSLEPNNAELAMGAAIVLDSPGMGFISRYLTLSKDDKKLGLGPTIDQDKTDQAIEHFERKCRAQCVTMAARATELQPDNVQCWRLRALILIPCSLDRLDIKTRDPDWLNILKQCKTHDPDNALYDYLAASKLLEASSTYEYSGNTTKIIITDPQLYAKAIQYIQYGQKQSRYVIGADGTDALHSFLSRSKASCLDQNDVALNRTNFLLLNGLLYRLWHAQTNRAEVMEQEGDVICPSILLQESLHTLDQFYQPGEMLIADHLSIACLKSTFERLEVLAENHPEVFSTAELSIIQAGTDNAILDEKVFLEAHKRVSNAQKQPDLTYAIITFLCASIALSTVLPLIIAGLCIWTAGKYSGKSMKKTTGVMGFYRHASIWLAGYTLTFVAVGMTAADIIPPALQGWLITALLFVSVTTFILWLLWHFVYRRKFQYTIRSLFVLTFLVALCCGILKLAQYDLGKLENIHLASRIPSRTWCGIEAIVLEDIITPMFGAWGWAFFQWLAYSGPFISIVLSLALLALWYNIHFNRVVARTPDCLPARWTGLFTCLNHSLIGVAVFWLIIYLLTVPSTINYVEADYQFNKASVQNPNKYKDDINAAIAEVRADKKWMDSIQADNP